VNRAPAIPTLLHAFRAPARGAAVLVLAAVVGLSACGGNDDAPAGSGSPAATPDRAETGPWEVSGGATTLELHPGLVDVLESTGVEVAASDGARRRGGRVVLPVVGGRLEGQPVEGRIDHGGTLELGPRGRVLSATKLALEPQRDRVTAEVGGRRIPLLSVDLGGIRPLDGARRIALGNRSARLSDEAVALLNERIGVSFFAPGARVADVSLEADLG
jgi:hypothetical protein